MLILLKKTYFPTVGWLTGLWGFQQIERGGKHRDGSKRGKQREKSKVKSFYINLNQENKNRKERMCGIFAYLNYNVNRERRFILQILFNGLRRLEYRGYDSAGVSIDHNKPLVFRQEGNIESLVKSVYQGNQFSISLSSFDWFTRDPWSNLIMEWI